MTTYKLYTDASQKEGFSTIAGVIVDEKLRPIVEFVKQEIHTNKTNELEEKALILGLQIALDCNIKKIICFSDNLNNINKINNKRDNVFENVKIYFDCFENIVFQHISRDENLYANALSNVPFNKTRRGDVLGAYHAVNRAKNRFYRRLKYGVDFDKQNNLKNKKTKASPMLKLKITKEIIFHLKNRSSLSNKESKTLIRLEKQLFELFMEIKNEKKLNMEYVEFLSSKKFF